jgi:hypothetical protein
MNCEGLVLTLRQWETRPSLTSLTGATPASEVQAVGPTIKSNVSPAASRATSGSLEPRLLSSRFPIAKEQLGRHVPKRAHSPTAVRPLEVTLGRRR